MPIWARRNLFSQISVNVIYKFCLITIFAILLVILQSIFAKWKYLVRNITYKFQVDKWIYVTVFVAKNLTTTLNHKYIPPIWLLEQLSYCYVMAFISSFVTTSRVYLCLLPVLLLVCRLEIVSFLKKIRPHFCSKRYNKGVKLTLYLHSCPPVVSLV